jgi:phage terminase large subunit
VTTLSIQTPRVFMPLLEPARYKGAYGGRGSGKSWFFAGSLVERCLMRPGTRWACIREVQKSLEQSVKRLLEDTIAAMGVGASFEIQDKKIHTPGGGVILFQGMQNHTAESIKSLEGFDGAWVEEAQSLSQRSLDLLRPTIREEGSELWFSWNPQQETDPVEKLLRGEEPPAGAIVIQANYTDNPFLPKVLRDELEYDLRRDPDKFAHVWKGGYLRNSEARVFRNWRVEEFDIPPDAIIRQGADWGFSVDPSVLIQCYVVGHTLYVPHEAWMIGCPIDNLPDLFATVPDSARWWITADSARPETINHMQRHGFPKIGPAVKGARSLEEGVEFLKSYDIVVHPRCRHVIDELTLYSYETDPLTGTVLPRLKDKKNHTIDALRYACEGARRAVKPAPQTVVRTVRTATPNTGWMAGLALIGGALASHLL